jgi:hypothetical protein
MTIISRIKNENKIRICIFPAAKNGIFTKETYYEHEHLSAVNFQPVQNICDIRILTQHHFQLISSGGQ